MTQAKKNNFNHVRNNKAEAIYFVIFIKIEGIL
jgi:hypothetical protein